jgi:predicted ATP-dependent endonuclease of OLD family
MIEAWVSSTEEESLQSKRALVKSLKIQQRKTKFARKLFGDFVPLLNYPSTIEIEASLNEEINESFFKVKQAEQKYLGGILPQIFQALSKDSQSVKGDSDLIIEEIKSLTENLKNYPAKGLQIVENLEKSVKLFEADEESKKAAIRVLNTYKNALEKVVNEQQKSFAVIENYLNAVNSFLEDKQIEVLWENLPKPSSRRNALGIKFNDNLATIPGINRALSSGERQIITLIYAASRMSDRQIVLVDEPEISLHVDWQRLLLNQMSRQLGERQIIFCTHSPVIGADYEDEVIMFEPTITQNPNPRKSQEEMELAW